MFIVKNSKKVAVKTENFEEAIVVFLNQLGEGPTHPKSVNDVMNVVDIFLKDQGRFQWGQVSITKK